MVFNLAQRRAQSRGGEAAAPATGPNAERAPAQIIDLTERRASTSLDAEMVQTLAEVWERWPGRWPKAVYTAALELERRGLFDEFGDAGISYVLDRMAAVYRRRGPAEPFAAATHSAEAK